MDELPKVVWTAWLQGMDEAPEIVRRSIQSWKANTDWEVRVLTEAGTAEWVQPGLLDDPRLGWLTWAQRSDLIRLDLLARHGGVWADATCWCARPLDEWVADLVMPSGFFAFARPGPDRLISSWFMAAAAGNVLVDRLRSDLRAYWVSQAFSNNSPSPMLRRLLDVTLTRNERVAQWWFSPVVARGLKAAPYFALHYRFARLVDQDPACRDAWLRTTTIPADGPHLPQRLGLQRCATASTLAELGASGAPVFKLDWRAPIREGSILDVLTQSMATPPGAEPQSGGTRPPSRPTAARASGRAPAPSGPASAPTPGAPGAEPRPPSGSVTAIIPTIGAPTLAAAVESVLGQTYPCSVIVSVDGPASTVIGQIPPDPRVRVIHEHDIKRGPAAARRAGIAAAQSEFVAFLDDDDRWHPEKVARQVAAARGFLNAGAAHVAVACRVAAFDQTGRYLATVPDRLLMDADSVAEYIFSRERIRPGETAIGSSMLLFDRGSFDDLPFTEDGYLHGDWDLLLAFDRLDRRSLHMLPEVLVEYTRNQRNTSASTTAKWDESLAWFDRHCGQLSKRAYGNGLLCHAGTLAWRQRDYRGAFQVARRAATHGRPTLAAWAFFVGTGIVPPGLASFAGRAALRARHLASAPPRMPAAGSQSDNAHPPRHRSGHRCRAARAALKGRLGRSRPKAEGT